MKNFLKKIIKEKTDRGFTILETLVAVFILVLSITGPMVFAQSGLRTAFLARDQITAFFLAQDAIETIKNMRDNNALKSSNNWLDDIYKCNEQTSVGCKVYIDTTIEDANDLIPEIELCGLGGASDDCPLLKVNSAGRFGYNFGTGQSEPSRFTRSIYLFESASDDELEIVVEVSWTSNVRIGGSRIVVQENIYNWIPGQGGI